MAAKQGIKGEVTGVGLAVRVVDRFRMEKTLSPISGGAGWGGYLRVITEINNLTNEWQPTSNPRPEVAMTSPGKLIRGVFSSAAAPVGANFSIGIFELDNINGLIAGLNPDFIVTSAIFPFYFNYTITKAAAVIAVRENAPLAPIIDGVLKVLGQIDN